MYPVYLILAGACFALMFFVVVEVDLGTTSDIFTALFLGVGLMFLFEGFTDYRDGKALPGESAQEDEHRQKIRRITGGSRTPSPPSRPQRRRMPR